MSVGEREELLGGIRASADRLRRLASDLNTAARSEDDTLPMRLEEVSLTEVLRSAAVRVGAAGGDVSIVPDVPRETMFHADPGRLGQALDNLVDNAVRHGRAPVGLIGTADHDVRIRVTDAGPGIPAELVPRLFERYAATGTSGRTGLGLYLVREIAQRHGGDVTYHPPTRGDPVAFEIRLPRRPRIEP
jgi:signal transduction histidine kinase